MAETNIVYDYEVNQVRIFTDRAGVASQILTRSNHQAEVVEMRNGGPCGICKAARVLSPEQIKDVLSELEQPHKLIAQLCYYTAARVGEVTKLSREDIDLDSRAIVYRAGNTKTGDSRTAHICDELLQALNDANLPKSGFIFPSPRSSGRKSVDGIQRGSISRQSVDAAFRDTFDLLGITGASTHSFRCSMATHLSREGLTLADIAQITGHRDLASLSHYLDADTDKAVSALERVAKRSRNCIAIL